MTKEQLKEKLVASDVTLIEPFVAFYERMNLSEYRDIEITPGKIRITKRGYEKTPGSIKRLK